MRHLLTTAIVPFKFQLSGLPLLTATQVVFVRHTGQDSLPDDSEITEELATALERLHAVQEKRVRVSVYNDGTTEWEILP